MTISFEAAGADRRQAVASGVPSQGNGIPAGGVPGVRWRILGPVAAVRGAEVLDLGAPRQRAVLTLLLSRAGETITLSRIIEAVWGQDPPAYAVNVVHKHVGALRRVVEPGLPRRGQGNWLLSGAGGYRVVVSEDTLDLLRFRGLAARAQDCRDRAERLDLFEAALSLWRGPVAEDVAGEFGADPVLEAIEREQADVAIVAAEDALSLGQAGRILPALTLAARLHPADEIVHAVLIRSLSSTGQRAVALETFESLRVMLDEELGVSPGPVLADAHLAVLRDEVNVSARPGRGPRAPALPVPRQLPADAIGFVGREEEVRAIVAGLRGGPGVASVVTGTAGVGKTTVAVRAAHDLAGDFPDGQLYVDLRGFGPAPAVPARDVLGRFLRVLDVPADRIPEDTDDRAALYRSALGDRRMLVVLDNASDSGHVLPLLPGVGPSRVIVTSRRQLRGLAATGVQVVALDLFDRSQSERFLRIRLSDRAVDDEPAAADDLIEISGGLPLALSLLAARAAHAANIPLADIAAAFRGLGTPLDALSDRGDPRTSTRSILSWSYMSLTPGAGRLFTLLAIHPSANVPADEAAALAGVDVAAARGLMDELVEANMAAERAGGRFWRHDLLCQYAAELLAEAGPGVREPAEGRLYEYLTLRAVAAARALSPVRVLPGASDWATAAALPRPLTESEATDWFDEAHEALMSLVSRAPLARYDSHVWRLAWALDHYLDRRGAWRELLAMYEAGLAAAERSGDPIARVVMRRGLARARANLGHFVLAADEVYAALEALLVCPAADPDFISETYRQLSWILSEQGDFEGALKAARSALDLHSGDSRAPVRAFALNAVGYCEAQLGLHEQALKHCTAALRLLEHTAHRYGQADTWHSLGLIHARVGNPALAAQAHERALDLYRALGVRYAEADTSFELGLVYADLRRTALARHYFETALRVFGELGHERAGTVVDALTRLDHADLVREPSSP